MLGGAPREIGIGLLESSFTECMHHRRASECFREKYNFWMLAINAVNQLMPELHRFCVWVINSKYLYAL